MRGSSISPSTSSTREARAAGRSLHPACWAPPSSQEPLALHGVIADFRPPDIIRIAPSPLYNTYEDIWRVVKHIQEIIDTCEYEKIPMKRKPIS